MGIRAAATLAVVLFAATGHASASGQGPRHARVVVRMHVDATVSRTTEAFGPIAESKWSSDFRPTFLYPDEPRQVEGAVFTTPDGAYWILHDYSPLQGRVQYIVLHPRSLQLTLTIRVTPSGHGSDVAMTYDLIAFDDEGMRHLDRIKGHSAQLGSGMEAAISKYLREAS